MEIYQICSLRNENGSKEKQCKYSLLASIVCQLRILLCLCRIENSKDLPQLSSCFNRVIKESMLQVSSSAVILYTIPFHLLCTLCSVHTVHCAQLRGLLNECLLFRAMRSITLNICNVFPENTNIIFCLRLTEVRDHIIHIVVYTYSKWHHIPELKFKSYEILYTVIIYQFNFSYDQFHKI